LIIYEDSYSVNNFLRSLPSFVKHLFSYNCRVTSDHMSGKFGKCYAVLLVCLVSGNYFYKVNYLLLTLRLGRYHCLVKCGGLYQNGPKPKRLTNFWHVQNGPKRCPKWPNAGTKRPRAM